MPHTPDPMPPRLVAVLVTYNRLAKLRHALPQLLAQLSGPLQAVVVVDNASDDGTDAWLASLDAPGLVVLRNPRNLGGAGGFEAGMRHAVATFDPDWLVVMDDDAYPEPAALARFAAMPTQGAEAMAAAVYLPDGTISEMNRPSINPFWHRDAFARTLRRGRGGFHIADAAFDAPPMQIDVASFVGLFISRAAVQRVGYPDPRLFLYGDDSIYTLGLRAAGGRILFAPELRFVHDCSTFAAADRRFRPLWKVYYYHRNLLILYRLAAGAWFWPALLVVLPKWLMRLRDHAGQRRAFLRLLGAAVRDGLRQRTTRSFDQVQKLAGAPRP